MRKYTGVEKTEILTPKEHEVIGNALNKLGKTSMKDLSEEEKETLTTSLEEETRA